MTSDEDRQHAESVLQTLRRRLRIQQLVRIRQGDRVDPAVVLDIEDMQYNIAALEPIVQSDLSPEVREIVKSRVDDGVFIYSTVVKWGERLNVQGEQLAGVQGQIGTAQGLLDSLAKLLENERDQRIHGQLMIQETLKHLAGLVENERTQRVSGQVRNYLLARRSYRVLLVFVIIVTASIVSSLIWYTFGGIIWHMFLSS